MDIGVPDRDVGLRVPLAPLRGCKPKAPVWFQQLETRPAEVRRLRLAGAEIEMLIWGERGKPGILFVHGMMANAHWWQHIGPFFADDYRCAAISWSGMGGSTWRNAYSLELFAEEAMAAITAAGLDESSLPPLIVAHSFGALPAATAAVQYGTRLAGVILLDKSFVAPAASRPISLRVYDLEEFPDLPAALATFHLSPSEPCDNLYILDAIGRHSFACENGGAGQRYKLRFDPLLRQRLIRDVAPDLAQARCPLAFIWGARSNIHTAATDAYLREVVPTAPQATIPDSGHHLMVDQPLALVAALRGLLSAWPSRCRGVAP